MKKLAFLLAFVLSLGLAQAKPKYNHLFGPHAVLQQNADVTISGTADRPGINIKVSPSWTSDVTECIADPSGYWTATISTPEASFEKRSVTIDYDGVSDTVDDLLIGEVWLATGQSNMQMPLKGFDGCNVLGGYDEVAASGDWKDKIRFYTVPTAQSWEPVDTLSQQWQCASPQASQDFSATAWYFAKRLSQVLGVPVGIVNIAYGGSRVESWLPRDILEGYSDVSLEPADVEAMTHYVRPLLMYNAMFLPIRDYTYTGIIWYQGCSNVGHHDTYPERLATMVAHWRDQLGDKDASLPFYEVEIAPYEYDASGQGTMGAYLREAQWRAADIIPNSAIISTNNLAEPFERFNIHPGNKAGVGNRLANLALNRKYGHKEFLADSPRYKGHTVKGNEVWVAIDSPCHGICRNYMIEGFEVAGDDHVFHPADEARLNWQTNEIVVSSKDVPQPVAVRYCFRDFQPGTLYAGDYLPLVPFRSDDWE